MFTKLALKPSSTVGGEVGIPGVIYNESEEWTNRSSRAVKEGKVTTSPAVSWK